MPKRVNTYAGYSAADIKNRATIPAQNDIVLGTTYVDCTIIKLGDIHTDINETTYALSLLNKSLNINEYSYFAPGWWILQSSAMFFQKDTAPYETGDFACYNHNAQPPYKENISSAAKIPPGGGDVSIHANIVIGEIDWRNVIIAGIDAIEQICRQGAAIKGTQSITYTDSAHQNDFIFSFNVFMSGPGTLTVYHQFNKDGNKVADIPNIVEHNIVVTETNPSHIGTVMLDQLLQDAHPTWTLEYNSTTSDISPGAMGDALYTLRDLWISTIPGGDGDISRWNMELYARLNGSKVWYLVYEQQLWPVDGVNIINDSLPFAVETFADVIDFELRDKVVI